MAHGELRVRSGKLRRRLEIQQAIETQGPTGEMAVTWSTFATVHGSVEPIRGREFWAAKEMQAQVDTRIRIRYLEGVTPKMQVLDGITVYLIYAVIDPEMRHIEMQLMCQQVVAT
jgi:SPP1 family predicted phage head-tail adaptor